MGIFGNKQQKLAEQSSTTNKTLNLKKGNVALNLTFRVDIKQEMKDLLELFAKAVKDIESELAKLDK